MAVGGDSLNSDFFMERVYCFQSALDTFFCVSISWSLSSSSLICFLTMSFLLSVDNDFFQTCITDCSINTPYHTLPYLPASFTYHHTSGVDLHKFVL